SLAATASDNRGVAGVQFKVDGANVGAEDTTTPYAMAWDTTGFATGNHVVTAVARDAAGNSTTSSPVTVNLQAAGLLGQWQGPISMPMVTVHASLMPNGKILALDGQDSGLMARVWDPVSNTFTAVTAPVNVFCGGHTILPDGRVIVVGGHDNAAHVGLKATNIFNPQTQSWTQTNNMQFARWYPTATAMPDGRVLVMSGETNCDGCYVTKHELFNPVTNTWSTMAASTDMSFAYY